MRLPRVALRTLLFTIMLTGLPSLVSADSRAEGSQFGAALRPRPSVFAQPQAQSNYQIVYSFKGGRDGGAPIGGLIAQNGLLYGTTAGSNGGADQGTVFVLSPNGVESVLHRFSGAPDGAEPLASLTALDGELYGTTNYGGDVSAESKRGCGTIFAISPSGTESVLSRFKCGLDGWSPRDQLLAYGGALYGTTFSGGGPTGSGTVFAANTDGTRNVLYRFEGTQHGSQPVAGLVAVNGILYGSTTEGGDQYGGYGVIFSITPAGDFNVIHRCTFLQTGPSANLLVLDGVFYGTTGGGGPYKQGTFFSITPSGTETVLHNFTGGKNEGGSPTGPLIALNGALYGTTEFGGAYGQGTVFKISSTGTETILHSFAAGADGALPFSGLTVLNGALYGTTDAGGTMNAGTVFRIAP